MIVVPASFQIEERNEIRGGLDNIERAGRTCYKSEDKIKMGSGDKFVANCVKRHHEAMLEHGDYIFLVDDNEVWDKICLHLRIMREYLGVSPQMYMTDRGGRKIISGNIRAWRELLAGTGVSGYFYGLIDPIYTSDINKDLFGLVSTGHVRQIFYRDLQGRVEKLTHQRQTVRFIVDRGISHEIVRHRLFSFAQESTRYCKYSQDKFGSQITVIEPCYLAKDSQSYHNWEDLCGASEHFYFQMLDNGCTSQEARAVLPTSLKTEIVVTGNLMEWKHFFDLRARQITGPVHPQMLEVAKPLYEMDKLLLPDVFID